MTKGSVGMVQRITGPVVDILFDEKKSIAQEVVQARKELKALEDQYE